jgi:hypothetical protein
MLTLAAQTKGRGFSAALASNLRPISKRRLPH